MKIPTRDEILESRAVPKPIPEKSGVKAGAAPKTGVKPKERPASKGRVHKGRTRN